MSLQFAYNELSQKQDIKEFGQILDQCFMSLSGQGEDYVHRVGKERCRIITTNEQIIGGLAIIPLGQWWGNACVEMGGIAAVGIAAEFRGKGAARVLMQEAVKEMYASGVAISALFPATQYLYRQVGYEQAGIGCVWEIDSAKINLHQQILRFTRVETQDLSIFEGLYTKKSQLQNGYLRRDRFIWNEKIRSDGETVYGYLIGDEEQPQGYIIYSQHSLSGKNVLRIRDWVLLNEDAIASFWSFLANTRSQIECVRWVDAGISALTLVLPEQNERLHNASQWMLRIVNLVKALEQRGYPPALETELHLQIQDDLISENNGRFILKIAQGRGKVQTGGNGDLKMDIASFAPLYTGLFNPGQLQTIGKLTANSTNISTATQIFAGTVPSISDYF